MKNLILVVLFLFCAIGIVFCAQKEDSPVYSAKGSVSEEVYLKVELVTVSSFDVTPDWAPLPKPEAVTDGNLLTRWSSGYIPGQWICLDFGQPKVISKIVIFWEAAYAVDYDVLTSLDEKDWQPVLSLKGQDGGIDEIEFAPLKARFIKILGKKRFNPQWGISLWEFLCFGPKDENSTDKPLSFVYARLADQLSGEKTQEVDPEMEEPQASPGALALDEFQKGVAYTSWGRTELGIEASDKTLEHLHGIGVRHIGIMIVWMQDTIEENTISSDLKDTPDDEALVHAINKAHCLGMKVMLKPHVDVRTGQWRGDIIPSQDWFAAYKKYLIYYARLAAQYNVELFSIGTELVNTTLPMWQSQWEDVIKEVRSVFPGRLVYSANWDEYKTVDLWDKLDFIGIDAYFPLTEKKNPAKEELIAAWRHNALEIDNWLKEKKLNKPVVFNEVGYCSADGTNMQPWSVLSNLEKEFIDQEEQADCLEAMLIACSDYPWFKGFYWWNYFPQERWSPLGYTIRGKQAEQVLADWLKKL
ncbi:MAG: discoidin domain-containing protein [Candidatus Omnitrophota bacterium]|nr:discoidin domain-containing protein [Candidatus Omnitrophota bacterium]